MALQVAIDGVYAAGLPPDDRGFGLGDGVFETMAIVGSSIPAWPLHCRRLQRGLGRLGLGCLDEATLKASWSALRLPDRGVLKLVVTAGSGPGGYQRPSNRRLRRVAMVIDQAPGWPDDGVRLFDCKTRLAHQAQLAGIKHLCRLEQVLARAEWTDPAYADGLMRDQDGKLIETTCANLLLRAGGRWLTPGLTQCGVAGVMRERVMNYLAQKGDSVEVADVTDDTLSSADEVLVLNSVRGIAAVVEYLQHRWSPGQGGRELQLALTENPYLGMV